MSRFRPAARWTAGVLVFAATSPALPSLADDGIANRAERLTLRVVEPIDVPAVVSPQNSPPAAAPEEVPPPHRAPVYIPLDAARLTQSPAAPSPAAGRTPSSSPRAGDLKPRDFGTRDFGPRDFGPLGFKPIGDLTADPAVGTSDTGAEVDRDDRPADQMPTLEFVSMPSTDITPAWAPGTPLRLSSTHQPLYFEDVNLERYGSPQHPHLQPLVSGVRFFGAAAALPYKMTLQHPRKRYRYAHAFEAGRYGFREPNLPPRDRRAALVETGAILGLILLIP